MYIFQEINAVSFKFGVRSTHTIDKGIIQRLTDLNSPPVDMGSWSIYATLVTADVAFSADSSMKPTEFSAHSYESIHEFDNDAFAESVEAEFPDARVSFTDNGTRCNISLNKNIKETCPSEILAEVEKIYIDLGLKDAIFDEIYIYMSDTASGERCYISFNILGKLVFCEGGRFDAYTEDFYKAVKASDFCSREHIIMCHTHGKGMGFGIYDYETYLAKYRNK